MRVPVPLVEGTDIDRGPLHANAVRGARLAAIDQGIALLRTGYQRDSALWIHRLAVRCQQAEPPAERPAHTQRPRPRSGHEAAEALLCSVPGISTAGARALLAWFGSVAGVAAAGPHEWLDVPGIGPGAGTGARGDVPRRIPVRAADQPADLEPWLGIGWLK